MNTQIQARRFSISRRRGQRMLTADRNQGSNGLSSRLPCSSLCLAARISADGLLTPRRWASARHAQPWRLHIVAEAFQSFHQVLRGTFLQLSITGRGSLWSCPCSAAGADRPERACRAPGHCNRLASFGRFVVAASAAWIPPVARPGRMACGAAERRRGQLLRRSRRCGEATGMAWGPG